MRTIVLAAALALSCFAASAAWGGACDLGCGPQTRQTCLTSCAENKDQQTVAACKAACEEMMASCKPVCEAALKHQGKPEEMAAAAKAAWTEAKKKR